MHSYESLLQERRKGVTTVVGRPAGGDMPWTDFFNTPAYFDVHRGDRRAFYFTLTDKTTGDPLCVAHVIEKEDGWFASPLRGTYGGIDAAQPDIVLYDIFLEDMMRILRDAGGKRLTLALAPSAHDPGRWSLLLNVLLRHGFAIARHDVNYSLPVGATPLLERMERNNAKRVRKCMREGCIFGQLDTDANIEKAYAVIRENRESKGFPVTMTLAHMLQMKRTFPDRWLFFGVQRQDELIAASVCIRINTTILYVFYWGDLPQAHALSPVAFLADNLHAFCRNNGIGMLDVGTSTDDGVPNAGLMTFKKRLGCEESLKLTMTAKLA